MGSIRKWLTVLGFKPGKFGWLRTKTLDKYINSHSKHIFSRIFHTSSVCLDILMEYVSLNTRFSMFSLQREGIRHVNKWIFVCENNSIAKLPTKVHWNCDGNPNNWKILFFFLNKFICSANRCCKICQVVHKVISVYFLIFVFLSHTVAIHTLFKLNHYLSF